MKIKTEKLTETQLKIVKRLDNGDKIGLYPTGSKMGYGEYWRFASDKQVVPSKTLQALVDKGIIAYEDLLNGGNILTEVIKYNPYN